VLLSLNLCTVFCTCTCVQVIQEELGRPVSEVYSEITPEPVAAASLGQVHACLSGGLPVRGNG